LKAFKPELNFRILESTSEKVNGDDLEIVVKDSSGKFITFATQAKILYHNPPTDKKSGRKNLSDGKYDAMQHYVGKENPKNQIDLLLNYAKTNGQIPIYLLYNYVDMYFPVPVRCNMSFEIEQFGCSIISAQYLKDKHAQGDGNLPKNIKFSDLHPNLAQPWFVLPCCFPKMTVNEIVTELGAPKMAYDIKVKTRGSLVDDPQWKLAADPLLGRFIRETFFNEMKSEDSFSPMYRLVFGLENQ